MKTKKLSIEVEYFKKTHPDYDYSTGLSDFYKTAATTVDPNTNYHYNPTPEEGKASVLLNTGLGVVRKKGEWGLDYLNYLNGSQYVLPNYKIYYPGSDVYTDEYEMKSKRTFVIDRSDTTYNDHYGYPGDKFYKLAEYGSKHDHLFDGSFKSFRGGDTDFYNASFDRRMRKRDRQQERKEEEPQEENNNESKHSDGNPIINKKTTKIDKKSTKGVKWDDDGFGNIKNAKTYKIKNAPTHKSVYQKEEYIFGIIEGTGEDAIKAKDIEDAYIAGGNEIEEENLIKKKETLKAQSTIKKTKTKK